MAVFVCLGCKRLKPQMFLKKNLLGIPDYTFFNKQCYPGSGTLDNMDPAYSSCLSANACSKTHSQLESAAELKSSHVQEKFDDFSIKTVL